MSGKELMDEMFWAGYLEAMIGAGVVTADTPSEDVERMKAEFLSGLRGDG